MPNAIVQRFIDALKLAKTPYFIDDNSIVCGGAVMFTVLPYIDALEHVTYRLEVPKKFAVPQEFPHTMLFLTTVFGNKPSVLLRIGGPVMKLLLVGKPFDQKIDIGGISLNGVLDGETRIFLAEPIQDSLKTIAHASAMSAGHFLAISALICSI